MLRTRSLQYLALVVGALAGLIGVTGRDIVARVRFGLEFRGGYEIYYVASPSPGKTQVTPEDMLATAEILRQRADSIGMAEPEIHVEGDTHIRLKLAGLTSADESRSRLGNPAGLPTVLTEKYTQTVGSVLGNTALKETLTAGAIGIGCVFLLLVGLYRGMGALAVFCTIVYLWLLALAFIAFHATLSLSAVVAFVLGIGMAADASIICFERVREELARGRVAAEAVRLGFRGSFPTIRDANLVTSLAMIALFLAGIGPIQGFSLTMLVSIMISVATNFFLARQLCLWLAQTPSAPLGLVIGRGRPTGRGVAWDFLRFGKVGIVASAAVIVAGGLYYRAHGLNLDIDFTAGTALDIDLDRATTQGDATAVMTDAGVVPATVSVGGGGDRHIAARFDQVLRPVELAQIIGAFRTRYGGHVEYEENTADPGVARDFAARAIYAVLAAFASICLYIGLRFSWSVAAATLAAILHDLLLVSALFALFKLEVDVTYIAALLTIIGYSLNDKIVIFGRIRENLREAASAANGAPAGAPTTVRELVNSSIRQTLGRSLYTVLTVVMASAALYLFACEPLQMFSLAIMLGLLSGAYSSIFMAGLFWLGLRARVADGAAAGGGVLVHPRRLSRYLPAAAGVVAAAAAAAYLGVPRLLERPAASATAGSAAAALPTPGELAALEPIVDDALKLAKAGQLAAAKARLKDLEVAWDEQKSRLKARSIADWTSVDRSLDRALTELRSGQPDQSACNAALQTLLDKLHGLSGGAPAVGDKAADRAGPLGDVAPFATIATDTLRLVGSGDLSGAKARIADLESTWDKAEEQLRSHSPEAWSSVDKSIDRALTALRSGKPDAASCREALQGLLAKLHGYAGGTAAAAPTAEAPKTAVPHPASGPLGDLTEFEAITDATLKLVASGDLRGARARVKDLETAWDRAEEALKPRSPTAWTAVDKAIDRALAQLRSGKPDAVGCNDALTTLRAKLRSFETSAK